MNTSPNAKVVLCYGDSNVYGQMPGSLERYPSDVRWTGLLQNLLKSEYCIVEEGLGGRTTDLDNPNPDVPSRNGLDYYKPCLDGHLPVDIVVIMLWD